MPETSMIYPISHEGLEDLKGEIWTLDNIEKIDVIIREDEKPSLIISYKNYRGGDRNKPVIKKLVIQ